MPDWEAIEADRRRAKYRQIEAELQRQRGDLPPGPVPVPEGAELTTLLDDLARRPEPERLRRALAAWRRRPGYFLNRGRTMHFGAVLGLVAEEPAAFDVLVDGLRLPANEDEAALKIRRLHDLVAELRQAAQPTPGMMAHVQSNFWSRQSPDAWPPLWADGEGLLRQLGWLAETSEPAERYLAYRRLLLKLDARATQAAGLASWYNHERAFCGLDPSLVDRCRENAELLAEWHAAKAYAAPEAEQRAERNAVALRAEMYLVGQALQLPLDQAIGLPLRRGAMSLRTSNGPDRPFRADGFAALYVGTRPSPSESVLSVRIWVTDAGVAVGLHSGWMDTSYDPIGQAAQAALPPDLIFMRVLGHATGSRIEPAGREWPGGEFLVGRWFPGTSALDRPDFAAEVVGVLGAARPVVEALVALFADPPEPPDEVAPPAEPVSDIDPLATVADELLLDPGFVEDIVALLRDKGQVVLYGPPGTGKTFVAKRLAEALAPEAERRMVVQFHPSTSYEDFFEGFRPAPGEGGAMRYDLVPGPLAILAERARARPGVEHILVIDEINRGNLPRILGELLFLLEYRGEAVRSLYRPETPFSLPRNLLFIGTMNTADRSIALVDAALRRRFHFVPFFPHEGPLASLLRRWLERERGLLWVADLVDMINAELRERLGGPHLQLGPSHFMKPGLDEAHLRRVWDYSVFPFIEEQLYGDWAGVEAFRFDEVLRRFHRAEADFAADVDGLLPGTGLDLGAADGADA